MQRSERDYPRDKKKDSSNFLFGFGNWISSIMVDPRQILAGFLTVTMFVMLAHMIRRDHFHSNSQVRMSSTSKTQFEGSKYAEQSAVEVDSSGLWKEDAPELKPCWAQPSLEGDQSEGYVTFSLTDGPEYHVSQICNRNYTQWCRIKIFGCWIPHIDMPGESKIADAVVVARNLGATLVVPDIRGSKLGDKRDFDDVYDSQKFTTSLDGVVRVAKQPPSISTKKLAVVKVPNRVTKEHIAENIEPVFREKGNIRLATYFPSVNMKKDKTKTEIDAAACMAMFGTLELQPEIRGVVDSMVERLRTLSRKSDGRFVAVDLRVDVLEKKGCKDKSGSATKSCFNAGEIATFLRKIGFGKDTTIYLTQSRWDSSLDTLKELFPRTYTKEGIMPMDKKDQFLNPEAPTLEEVVDYYICSESDVFVPAISGLFYANVAGKRISSGKTQILVPADIPGSSASPDNYLSHYVTKQNHLAYSCFC